MSTVAQPAPGAAGTIVKPVNWFASNWGLLAAIAALIVVLLLPTPAALPVAGHRMLAILVFAVIVWMTEAIDYAVSAIVIAALMAFLLGLAPNVANPKVLLGTSAALTLAFSGFTSTGLVLVAAALFAAALPLMLRACCSPGHLERRHTPASSRTRTAVLQSATSRAGR